MRINATTVHVHPCLLPFHELTTPHLEYLRLVGVYPPWSEIHFASFIDRSACGATLHTLILDDILIRGSDLITLLPLIPAVRTLSLLDLRLNAITAKVIDTLSTTDALLGLTTLIVSGSYLFGTSQLLVMLKARAPSLHTVTLHLKYQEFAADKRCRLRAHTEVMAKRAEKYVMKCS
ncbi:hypothetical protein C8R46DRAFT_1206187 [Mycena filopes]|nr:hypothetical protein C8R46DRAFT_1206187 [Mycena filopes]